MLTVCPFIYSFGYYVWPCFLVWGVDRVCLYIRYLILTDFQSPSNPANQAELELVNQDTIRITARRHVPLGWRAGQHMYLALPTLGPIESHPFTIATLCNDEDQKGAKEMVYIIRARDGFTRRIRDFLVGHGGNCRLPIFMHGPYGAPPDITPFSTCVFVAGAYHRPLIIFRYTHTRVSLQVDLESRTSCLGSAACSCMHA